MCSRITVAIETKMCLAIPWALGRPEPCPAGRQHHRTLLRSWRELQRKGAAARQGDPASNRAGGSIITRYSDPMLRPANTRRQTEIPPEWALTSGHLLIRVVGLGSPLTSARTSGYRRPGYTGPVFTGGSARSVANASTTTRKGRASAKSASRAFNAISDLAGMPLEKPRGLDIRRASKHEEAHAT